MISLARKSIASYTRSLSLLYPQGQIGLVGVELHRSQLRPVDLPVYSFRRRLRDQCWAKVGIYGPMVYHRCWRNLFRPTTTLRLHERPRNGVIEPGEILIAKFSVATSCEQQGYF
jgi:hypothetical protein